MTAPGRGPGRPQAVPSAFRGAALVFGAVVIGIIGLQILDDSNGAGTAGDSSAPGVTTTTTADAVPAPHANPSDVTVKVYNASDVQGAAQALSEKLAATGYTMEDTDNFNGTRKGTLVQCRPGFEGDGAVMVAFAIGNNATAEPFPSDPPEGSENADCIVILGTA